MPVLLTQKFRVVPLLESVVVTVFRGPSSGWTGWPRWNQMRQQALKSKMHQDVRQVLADKNVMLWNEMLIAINYEDMGVVDEFMHGSSLVGAAPSTGLWPAKFTPATMFVHELYDIARRGRAQGVQAIEMDDDMLQSVWTQTLAEVEAGFLIGPIELVNIPAHIPLSKRFGVKQGAKTRCVDDFSRSGVNSCAQVSESPKPYTIDILASWIVVDAPWSCWCIMECQNLWLVRCIPTVCSTSWFIAVLAYLCGGTWRK